jgi:ABC-type transport system substrate-binding protein
MDNGRVVERVMDKKYASGPMEFQRWANIFLKNDAPCLVISKYSDYADNPYSGDCFFQRTSMFTYQPADLQMQEAWGYNKTKWSIQEVRQAYKEAFDE